MDRTLRACAKFESSNLGLILGSWDPNYIPWVDFWTMIFYNLKNSVQDESNGGSNFILSLIEVGH